MENQIVTQPNTAVSEVSLFSDFEKMVGMSEFLAKSDILPDTFKGKPANVFIALDMAQRMNMNPFMVAQNIYMVHGKPAWSSSFLIASINACGKFSNLEFEFSDENSKRGLGCRAYATRLSDGKVLRGSWVTMTMANAEGWTRKPGSKWLTMPQQMLSYRAASFWQRLYAPEVSMGIRDEEEVRDMSSVQDAQYTEVTDQPQLTKAESIAKKQISRMKAKEDDKHQDQTAAPEPEQADAPESEKIPATPAPNKNKAPFKGVFGTWMIWDDEKQNFVDSGKETLD